MSGPVPSNENAVQAQPKRSFPWMGLIVIVVVAALMLWAFSAYRSRTRLTLNTCLQNAQGLRELAPLRLAGVEVGYVKTVRPHPENHDCPVRVEMAITAPYELRIPSGSVTSIQTAGILGPSFLEIDVANASGPPLEDGATLPSREPLPEATINWERLIERWIDNCRGTPPIAGHADTSKTPPTKRPK